MGVRNTIKHVTKRGKRHIINKESRIIENHKKLLLMRSKTASQTTIELMKELMSFKKPNAIYFNKKNDIYPMENIIPLENFCSQHNCSIFIVGSHSKKRPHNFILGRLFDSHLLDMFELGIEHYVSSKCFKNAKIITANKSVIIFNGELFEIDDLYIALKNIFVDIFRGPEVADIRLQGIEHAWVFTAIENKIYLRSYKILLKKSGGRVPLVGLEEIGPRVDFVPRRNRLASEDLFRLACKQPEQIKVKKVKNIGKDVFGTKIGRIHMDKQQFSKLHAKKFKGLNSRSKAKNKRKSEEEHLGEKRLKLSDENLSK